MLDTAPLIPEITEEDIRWICSLMKLDSLDEERQSFLLSRSTLDVSACPGSGKTTLVVAKLAVLARKWPYRRKGICVLSHTNVAREEIQRLLGGSVVGQGLLTYPHFIDTIHGFVNRFLALPWLRSKGFPPPTIDDDVTTAYRRGTLKHEYWTVQNFLEAKHSSFDRLRICARDLSFVLGGKTFPAGQHTKSYRLAKQAVEEAAKAGYFCYDEMFVWARAFIEDFPAAVSWLRRRFPLVIIDEMQDTDEVQGDILGTIFPAASPDIIVQRVGDPNQTLFEDPDVNSGKREQFPDPARQLKIANSFRFGGKIAGLASPFAVMSVGPKGLCGMGPKRNSGILSECAAIFVFPDSTTAGVIDSYGRHILESFDDSALRHGRVTAVGAVHHDVADIPPGHAHFPKSVPHYWSGYASEIARKESNPRTLAQYFRVAQAAVSDAGNLSPGVERIAAGLVRLAGRVGDGSHVKRKTRMHRAIIDALGSNAEAIAAYRRLLAMSLIKGVALTESIWVNMKEDILGIACLLCGGVTDQSKAADFLEWSGVEPSIAECSQALPNAAAPNTYRVVSGGRFVDIRLSSIHLVKGQTHLATLVLNTFWHGHSSQRMLPWLLGEKVNVSGAGPQDRKRLVQAYVAMTRPSHMICLAVPRSKLGDDQAFSRHLAILAARGWRVAEIVDGDSHWLT